MFNPEEPTDDTPPSISILSPNNGTILTNTDVLIDWSAYDYESGLDYLK